MGGFTGAAYGIDWENSKKRWEAWWQCDVYDRVVMRVTAPRKHIDYDSINMIGYIPAWDSDPESEFMDFGQMYGRIMDSICRTYYGGEALPIFDHKWSVGHALAFGCQPEFNRFAAWCHPLPDNDRHSIKLDKNGPGWKWMMETTLKAAENCNGNYFVRADWGNHTGDILTTLYGNNELFMLMMDDPYRVKKAVDRVTDDLNELYRELWERVEVSGNEGTVNYIGCWSPHKTICLDCDISCMISGEMFEKFFVGALTRTMCEADFRVYHLDGPGAIKHLDKLLAITELHAIQWVPGAGKEEISQWFPLLKRIQQAGKALWISCQPGEVKTVLKELAPEGLCITTACETQDHAERLLEEVVL